MWECGWAALDIIQVLMGLSRGHIPLPDHSDDENEDETGCGTIDNALWPCMNLYANDNCGRIIMFEELCRSEIQRQGKDFIENNN